MILDVIFLIILVYFMQKGYSRGAIMSLLVFASTLLGFVVASKFSGTVSKLLFSVESDSLLYRLAPVLAYFIVFFAVVFLVRLAAKFSKKVIKKAQLSLIDKLVGTVFYFLVVVCVTSVFYWFLNLMHVLSPETMYASKSFRILEPFAERIFDILGSIFPFIKSSYQDLLEYFEQANAKLETYVGINR